MEGRSHPLRLPLPTPRRPMYQRTASSSSEASHASNGSHRSQGSEDQFVLSPSHTPAHENAPPRVMISRFATDSAVARHRLLLGKEVNTSPRDSKSNPRSPNYPRIAPASKSRPVVIELPAGRREDPTSVASSSIPPVPLSARGDVPGGYFPLHEDPESRVHIPHPFHLDADMARQSSLQRAAESSKSSADPRSLSPTHHPAHVSLNNTNNPAPPSASAPPDTPISSYMPSGHHDDVVLPMGKYYPSNWEKRHGKTPQQQTQPPATTITQPAAAISATKSEPQVPKLHQGDHPSAPNRPGSDIKRRLQQYQRDMVAQAAMAANALLAASSSGGGSAKSSAPAPSLLPNKGQLAATFLRTHKPLSPRLQPVGSPGGPVTPMSLEADSYLSFGLGSPSGRDMVVELPGVLDNGDGEGRRAGVVGKGKHRRRESRSMSSPVVEMGAASV
ncbi:hypothetical protein C8A01DRAFT_46990 [Parachaetomium inaequale]|uniref:Uncharacterized protein n=1 Tax=Parachaetomium inaequale TaxID=2588326 RepID=A0AAN6PES9_9PEZI|nr:hypothetical protein C8A01DRAFT_46990 [Parachaetomium inaequale]